jgi:hypothetical protein
MQVKHTIPSLYIKPSSWIWILGCFLRHGETLLEEMAMTWLRLLPRRLEFDPTSVLVHQYSYKKRGKWARNLPKNNALSEIGEQWTEKYFHSTTYDDFVPWRTNSARRLLLRVLSVVKISSLGRTSVSSGQLTYGRAYKSTAGRMVSTHMTVGTTVQAVLISTDGLPVTTFEAMSRLWQWNYDNLLP